MDVCSAVHELDGLLEALDAGVGFGGDADVFVEEMGEAAGADADVAGEFGDGGGGWGALEFCEGVVDGGGAARSAGFGEAMAESEVEEVEFLRGCWGLAEVVAEVEGGSAPEFFEGGLAVGEGVGVVGEEGEGAAGMEGDADEFGEVDGVDELVVGVDAEEESGGLGLERVGGVVGVGEVVAGERDDDLGAAVGEDALVAMDGVRGRRSTRRSG